MCRDLTKWLCVWFAQTEMNLNPMPGVACGINLKYQFIAEVLKRAGYVSRAAHPPAHRHPSHPALRARTHSAPTP